MCVWSIEADIIDFDNTDILERIYKNYEVERFLDAKDSMGIAACKGMGKTYLLKAKRMKLQQENPSMCVLPQDRLVDVSGTINLKPMHMKILSSYDNWVCIWISSISIYILSLDKFKTVINEEEKKQFPECVSTLLDCENTGVFNVLHRILNLDSKKSLNEIKDSSPLLFDYVQKINQSIVLFVDKLEEPFNREFYSLISDAKKVQVDYNASIWAYAQLSFVEAVYKFYSSRHHLKIFYGIRKEALYGGENVSIEYNKLRNRIVTIKYSQEDLYNMFKLYVKTEKASDLFYPEYIQDNPVKALVGVDSIEHNSGVREYVWDYIYRHSFQRPRDIMEMCMAIHDHLVMNKMFRDESTEGERIRTLRHWINEISTMECMQYISTLEPFMSRSDNINFKEKLMLFAQKLQTNVYTRKSMNYFCHNANNEIKPTECGTCENIHFFSTLYNIGLLGYIRKSVNDNKYHNHIKHIGESIFISNRPSLKDAELYYMHPGFGNIIQTKREINMLSYIPCPYIVNSFSQEIPDYQVRFTKDMIISMIGNRNDKSVFLTSVGENNKNLREMVKQILTDNGYKVYMYEDPNFPQIEGGVYGKTNDVAIPQDHCIDVILEKCKNLIYIFDNKFGMNYFGNKYLPYIERHRDTLIENPSMSFVEYLVAKENGKNVKVYVEENVDIACKEFIENGERDNYRSAIVNNNNVFKQLKAFNLLGNGTWLDKYSDNNDLREYINAHFPKKE